MVRDSARADVTADATFPTSFQENVIGDRSTGDAHDLGTAADGPQVIIRAPLGSGRERR